MTQSIQSSASNGILKLGRKIDFNGHDIRILSTKPFFLSGICLMRSKALSMPSLSKQFSPKEERTYEKVLTCFENTLKEMVSAYRGRVIGWFTVDKKFYMNMKLGEFVGILSRKPVIAFGSKVFYDDNCKTS